MLTLSVLPASAYVHPFHMDAPTPLEMFGPQSTYGQRSFDAESFGQVLSMGAEIAMSCTGGGVGCAIGVGQMLFGLMQGNGGRQQQQQPRQYAERPRTVTKHVGPTRQQLAAIERRAEEGAVRRFNQYLEEKGLMLAPRLTVRPSQSPQTPTPPAAQPAPPSATTPAPQVQQQRVLWSAVWRSELSLSPTPVFEPDTTVVSPRLRGFSDSARPVPIVGIPVDTPDTGTVMRKLLSL